MVRNGAIKFLSLTIMTTNTTAKMLRAISDRDLMLLANQVICNPLRVTQNIREPLSASTADYESADTWHKVGGTDTRWTRLHVKLEILYNRQMAIHRSHNITPVMLIMMLVHL